MKAYYNEIDPFAAQWLRELIKAGQIAPGDVDERSIEDVKPDELMGYTQCHFFAGIGVWSYALRQAGWPDDRPIWTGSCPCQPFSAAGKGGGFDDERHLWPSFAWLIKQCAPPVLFGEQVASKATGPWFDLVQNDLERMGYAFGLVPFPAAGVGAPHIRDRAYWVADSASSRRQEQCANSPGSAKRSSPEGVGQRLGSGGVCALADAQCSGLQGCERSGQAGEKRAPSGHRAECGGDSGAGPTNGFWRDVDWLGCRDGKYRPVEPGTFPLANGSAARVGRLRGYGNAINAEAAQAFISAYMKVAS